MTFSSFHQLIDNRTPLTALLHKEDLAQQKVALHDRIELSREFLNPVEYMTVSLWFGILNNDRFSAEEIVKETKSDPAFAALYAQVTTPAEVLAILASAVRKMADHAPSVNICQAAIHTHRQVPPGQHYIM